MKKRNKLTFDRALFIDSSNLEEIKRWNATGVIDGVTTNQMIMLHDRLSFKDYRNVIKKICQEMKEKPVSVELTNSKASVNQMISEAKSLNEISDNIVVKVPLIPETDKSILVIKELVKLNIAVNVTLMMIFEQMILAILATRFSKKISYVSIFWGRTIEDHAKYRSRSDFMAKYPRVGGESHINSIPANIVEQTARFLKEGNYNNPKIIVGSLRTASMVGEAYAAGANIATVAPDLLMAMLFSERTIETAAQFDEAWEKIKAAA